MSAIPESLRSALIQRGYCIIWSDEGVVANLMCPWCKGKRRAMRRCSLCKGTGFRDQKVLA